MVPLACKRANPILPLFFLVDYQEIDIEPVFAGQNEPNGLI